MILPDFEAWAIFARVAECGSFSRAAEALGLSKPTVSKAVARLEQNLSGSLFHRTSRKLSLTELGRTALPHAIQILTTAETAECELRDTVLRPQGLIRIAAPLSFGIHHLAPALPLFLRRFPAVSIEVDYSDDLTDIVAEGYDVAVRIGTLASSSLRSRRICDIPMHIIAAPSLLAHRPAPSRPADLDDWEAAIYTNTREAPAVTLRNAAGEEHVWHQAGRLRANTAEGLLPAIRSGMAVGALPEFTVWDDIAAGRLAMVLPAWQPKPLGLFLVTPPSPLRPARVTALLSYLGEHFAGAPWKAPSSAD